LTKPITNIPHDALRYKIRLREKSMALVDIRFADRLERWVLGPDGDYGSKLLYLHGINSQWHIKQ